MPVLTSAQIVIKVNKDRTIDIVREQISKCGCVSADTLAIQTGKPADEVKDVLKVLAGSGEVSCNSDFTLCCSDKETLVGLSAKLKKLRG
ncbi:MAG: hypothetical protein PHH85_02135 [Candidatus Methanoperedens sp.]|nr:hypothetical protein [Candidatus Methanoperedens sp.]